MIDIQQYADNNILFDNRYRLIRPLSTDGGTADVWLATDTFMVDATDSDEQDNHDVIAIKIYRPKNALDVNGEKIFRDEYKIVQNCKHINLLQPSHFSIFRDTPYLELPYCQRGSSENLIGKPLTAQQLWQYIHEVAEGLHYLHSLSSPIIHQDIKPANILIDDNGRYVITDFGISATVGHATSGYSYDDEYSGTMAYMAPERFDEGYVPVPESDIWALGVTLYEIILNNVPFGDEGGLLQKEDNRYQPLPKSVPADIRKLIDSCLNINPAKRPTAREVADIADRHLNRSNAAYIWAAVIATVIIAGALAFFLYEPSTDTQSPTPTTQQPTPDAVFRDAVYYLDNGTVQETKRGAEVIDSLIASDYAPALFEYAKTYGWRSNAITIKRKMKLGVKCYDSQSEDKFLPVSKEINQKTVACLKKIIDTGQAAEKTTEIGPGIKAEAAYMLACYYIIDNKFQPIDNKEGLRLLHIALDNAQQAHNTSLTRQCSDAIESLK